MTTTLTHTTISAIGQIITSQHLMSTNFEEIEKLFEFCVQSILPQFCAETITMPV